VRLQVGPQTRRPGPGPPAAGWRCQWEPEHIVHNVPCTRRTDLSLSARTSFRRPGHSLAREAAAGQGCVPVRLRLPLTGQVDSEPVRAGPGPPIPRRHPSVTESRPRGLVLRGRTTGRAEKLKYPNTGWPLTAAAWTVQKWEHSSPNRRVTLPVSLRCHWHVNGAPGLDDVR
jgi:hypothetical protein